MIEVLILILLGPLVLWCCWLTRVAFKTRACLAEIVPWIKQVDAELDLLQRPEEKPREP